MNKFVFYGRDIADGCSVVMACWCLPDSFCIELVCELRNPCGLKTIAHAGANVDWPALLANLALGLTMAISRNMCLVRSLLSSIRMDARQLSTAQCHRRADLQILRENFVRDSGCSSKATPQSTQ